MKKYFFVLFIYFLPSDQSYVFAQTMLKDTMWIATFTSMTTGNSKSIAGHFTDLAKFEKTSKKTIPEMQNDLIKVELNFLLTNITLVDTVPYKKAVSFYENHCSLLSNCDEFDFYYGYTSTNNWYLFGATESYIDNKIVAEGKGSLYLKGTTGFYNNNKKVACYVIKIIKNGDIIKKSTPENTWISFYAKNDKQSKSSLVIGVCQNQEGPNLQGYYYVNIPLDFEGWKYFSIPYSNFHWGKSNEHEEFEVEKNCDKISSIQYELCSPLENDEQSVHLDYLSILFRNSK